MSEEGKSPEVGNSESPEDKPEAKAKREAVALLKLIRDVYNFDNE